jgi:hypothetical protein
MIPSSWYFPATRLVDGGELNVFSDMGWLSGGEDKRGHERGDGEQRKTANGAAHRHLGRRPGGPNELTKRGKFGRTYVQES